MTNFDSVKGFFTISGSADLPKSWNPNENFGFNVNQDGSKEGPIFNYSYNDIVSGFKEPVEVVSVCGFDSGIIDDVSHLIIEKPNTDPDFTVSTEDYGWRSVFKVLEYVTVNQDTVTVNDLENDLLPSTGLKQGTTFITRNTLYPNRINRITFSIDFSQDTDVTDLVSFTIYLFADEFMKNEAHSKYKVYFYQDQSDPEDDIIDANEWQTQIINKHLEIFQTGRYKYVKTLSSFYVDGGYQTLHHFYVYTVVEEFTQEEVEDAIREYLLDILGKSLSWCTLHYPLLFSNKIINLYPVIETITTTSGDVVINPISLQTFMDKLVSKGYNDEDNNYKKAEVFYVGSEDGTGAINPIPFPIIAIDNETNSNVNPISNTFFSYIPRYTEFPGFDENFAQSSQPIEFHHLVFITMMIITGKMASDDDTIAGLGIPQEYRFSIVRDSATNEITDIRFSMLGVSYIVHNG